MTINWFSPVPPTRSSIAFDTAAVLPALARQAEVVVWAHEPTWSPVLERHARVRHYDPKAMPWSEINQADVTIYHFGNHTGFHGPIWEVNQQHPGIVVLHDLNMQHFFAGMLEPGIISRDEYLKMMEFHHPDIGREAGEAFLLGERTVYEIRGDCPLTGAAFEHATGIAVHTPKAHSTLATASDLPVAYVPLFALPEAAEPPAISALREDGASRIIIFGFLGLNRRLSSLFQALHQFPERARFHLDIYGAVEEEESFIQMVEDLGLRSLVSFHGFVADADLVAALDASDLAINLRDPTMGEASASQLRIWQHALPSLVTNIGWYATLPADTVAFVRRDAELADIQAHLAGFLATPERYRELGRAGRKYVEQHHTVDAYVEGLMDLIDRVSEHQARESVRWLSGRAGQSMRPWFDEEAASILLPGVASAISGLAGRSAMGR